MNNQQAYAYLKQAAKNGTRLGLERMKEILYRLGSPQEQTRTVHIAGTNGKGSVGIMLAYILQKSGLKTGHFATPSMCSVKDMFRINNQMISESLFTEIITEVAYYAEQMTDKPTEFELLTAVAFMLFARQKCDISVIECCMGGDTDCTNMMTSPLLSIITNIQKDHCAFLGNTLTEIAGHKAGIIKKGCPVLTGVSGEAEQVILERAKILEAEVFYPEENLDLISCHTAEGIDCTCNDFGKLHVSLSGLYQTENIRLVLSAVKILRKQGILIPDSAVHEGLADCHWAGRFEFLRKQNPVVLFDGAHNPAGMSQAVKSIQHYLDEKRKIFIIGVMKDKDYVQFAEMLSPLGEKFFTVRPDNPRALEAEVLAETFCQRTACAEACYSVQEAVQKAFQYTRNAEDTAIICLGSLYLYREFTEALRKTEKER